MTIEICSIKCFGKLINSLKLQSFDNFLKQFEITIKSLSNFNAILLVLDNAKIKILSFFNKKLQERNHANICTVVKCLHNVH